MLKRLLLFLVLSCAATGFAQELTVRPARPGGVYQVGEKIRWKLTSGPDIEKVSYLLKRGGLTEVGRGELVPKDGEATLETSLDAPGSVLAEFTATRTGKAPLKALAGAIRVESGELSMNGRRVRWPRSVPQALRLGIALIPEERKTEGLVLELSGWNNVISTDLRRVARLGLLDHRLAKERSLAAYFHRGFWQPMDTLRDRNQLEEVWAGGRAPWKTW